MTAGTTCLIAGVRKDSKTHNPVPLPATLPLSLSHQGRVVDAFKKYSWLFGDTVHDRCLAITGGMLRGTETTLPLPHSQLYTFKIVLSAPSYCFILLYIRHWWENYCHADGCRIPLKNKLYIAAHDQILVPIHCLDSLDYHKSIRECQPESVSLWHLALLNEAWYITA